MSQGLLARIVYKSQIYVCTAHGKKKKITFFDCGLKSLYVAIIKAKKSMRVFGYVLLKIRVGRQDHFLKFFKIIFFA